MRATLACCVALILASGCGGQRTLGAGKVVVEIKVHTLSPGVRPRPRTTHFALTCNPTGGTLPLAARICRDIALHPRAMLDPPEGRSTCAGGPFIPQLEITAGFDGKTTHLGGRPFCDWPGAASAVYYAATQRDKDGSLGRAEAQLRCDEDPALLATPTPLTLVMLCQRGSAQRQGIVMLLARNAIGQAAAFPQTPGSQRCTVRTGDADHRPIAGHCSASLDDTGPKPTVTFVQNWRQHGVTASHTWRVIVDDYGGHVVAESGAVPPQLWH